MKTFVRLKYCWIALLMLCNFSCSDWLDIGSEDRIMENDLFNSKAGFMTALNGVYIELLDNSLYGGALTYTTADVLAQYYDCSDEEHSYNKLSVYDAETKKEAFATTWSRAWYLISNVNTIIEHCDQDKGVLDDEYYHVIKGEALALRGLLHFELFRIFGPIYSVDADQECIPYSRSSDLVVRELLTAEQVQDYILKDFKAAEQLLEGYDPVITKGTLFSDAENGLSNGMRYRSLRLNYYAVQACVARLAMYVGNTSLALEYAEKVIKKTQEDNNWFPFVTREAAFNVDAPDRIYRTEILFGLYNLKRKQVYESNFSNSLSGLRVLRPTDDYISWIYEDNINDWRFTQLWQTMLDPDDIDNKTQQKYFIKYMEVNDKGIQYLMPLIRISEMYLIAAECEGDKTLQYAYLNKLRNARGVEDADDSGNIIDKIEKEYRKEFIGEGQLFWFFKRRGQQELTAGNESYVTMQKDFYLFRLPQAETDHRGIN